MFIGPRLPALSIKEDPIKYEETDAEHRDIGAQTEIVGYMPTLPGLWEFNEIKGVLEEVIQDELQPPQLEAFDSMDDKTTPHRVIPDNLPPPQLEVIDSSKGHCLIAPHMRNVLKTHHPVFPLMNQQLTRPHGV